jgi:hypothetical protein
LRLAQAQLLGHIPWSAQAQAVWVPWYKTETTKKQYGQIAALSNRAEAHVLRFALVYALLDASPDIKLPHIEAAIALWEYAQASVIFIFGSLSGNTIADKIYQELGYGRLTRSQVMDIFQRNISANVLQTALQLLEEQGKARCIRSREPGKAGRPSEIWERLR